MGPALRGVRARAGNGHSTGSQLAGSLLLARPRLTGPVVGLFQKRTEIARRQLIRICFSVAVTKLYLE